MEEKEKKKKKLTLSGFSKKTHNIENYAQRSGKTSVVIRKQPSRRWGEKKFQPRDNNLINHKGLTPGMLLTLGAKKIKTLNDFAELSTDELVGGYDEKKGVRFKIDGYLEEFALTKNEADELIINARNIVFK